MMRVFYLAKMAEPVVRAFSPVMMAWPVVRVFYLVREIELAMTKLFAKRKNSN